MTELERLLALDEIMLLKAKADRALGTGDWDALLALHAPDHRTLDDAHDGWNSAAEMIDKLRQALPPGATMVHHAHTPDIDFESPTRASGIWGAEENVFWMQGDQEHWRQRFGFEHEGYEKRDGVWLFISRRFRRTHVRTSEDAATTDA